MNIFDERIEKAKKICILGHQRPDGDCIGAALSVYKYIKNKYDNKKDVKIYLDEFSSRYMILPNADAISNDLKDATIFDLVIAVDTSNIERLIEYERYFKEAKDTMVIDHHENNTLPANVSIVFPETISTCEILYDFFDKKYVDKEIATCLYIGIATDSGVFRYNDTSKKTLQVAGELIEYGFNFTKLLDEIIFDNTLNQRKSQGIAFDRLELICKGQVSFSYLNENDLRSLNLTKLDIDNIVVYLREIDNIKVAVFAYQVGHNIYKLSLRSKDKDINVATFARAHEGGGHALASGCIYYGDIEKIKKHLEIDLEEFIEKTKSI